MLKRESENLSRKPGDLFINRHSDSLKKSQLTLSLGILKKGDINADADNDDEVRTSASQNHATTTLSTEKFFLRTQHL